MARWEFKLPDIGEGVTEGEIVAWLVHPGDAVKEDQSVVELMTDKATLTITAPKSGSVIETRGRPGDVVPVNEVLVVFEVDEAAAPAVGPAARVNGTTPPVQVAPAAPAAAGSSLGQPSYFNDKPIATPATRKLARDMNVDLRRVLPTGPQGRVTKRDVESFSNVEPAGGSLASSPRAQDHVAPRAKEEAAPTLLEERVPMAGLRRKIAQKMALSTTTAAHFTFVEECDATDLKRMRERLRVPAQGQGVTLNFLPFVVKAVVAALRKHPALNSSFDEATNEIVFRKYFNIGIATATAAGLVVPVLKDADRKSILDLAREIERLAAEARSGKAKLEDLQGSTFTITSLGAQSGLFATPIINFPEVAILGVHRIRARPVVKDGQVVVGDVMLLSLSFDHRIVDGHVGAAFAYEVIGYLEHPERLLMEMH